MILGYLFIIVYSLVVFFVGAIVEYKTGTGSEVHEAIRQCEAELPRNKQCEYVITARVKE